MGRYKNNVLWIAFALIATVYSLAPSDISTYNSNTRRLQESNPTTIKHLNRFTVFGERCTGTNFVQSLISDVFDVNLTFAFGFKHFFGHNPAPIRGIYSKESSDDTLFIAMVRNPLQWMASLRIKRSHQLPEHMINSTWTHFLTSEWYSIFDLDEHGGAFGKEIMNDRNIYGDKSRYKNIFELRASKVRYLVEDLPRAVKHYYFVRYEQILRNPVTFLQNVAFKLGRDPIPSNLMDVQTDSPFLLNCQEAVRRMLYYNSEIYSIPQQVKEYIYSHLNMSAEISAGYFNNL